MNSSVMPVSVNPIKVIEVSAEMTRPKAGGKKDEKEKFTITQYYSEEGILLAERIDEPVEYQMKYKWTTKTLGKGKNGKWGTYSDKSTISKT